MTACAVSSSCDWACLDVHVPAQVPSFREISRNVGSPFENSTVTPPVVIGFAQSSTTFTATCPGYPAGILCPSERRRNTGTRLVGVHPAIFALSFASDVAAEEGADGARTRTSATLWELPSENAKVILPLYTPGASPFVNG